MPRKIGGFACPTPGVECNGSAVKAEHGTPGAMVNIHKTPGEVLACEARFLVSHGYKRLGSRAFESPNGGPVLILSKKPGIRVQAGKEGGRVRAKGIKGW